MPRREETERQCALTREVKPIAELIRFAVSPDGEVVPDTDGKAEGRGVWISLGHKFVAEAQKKRRKSPTREFLLKLCLESLRPSPDRLTQASQ